MRNMEGSYTLASQRLDPRRGKRTAESLSRRIGERRRTGSTTKERSKSVWRGIARAMQDQEVGANLGCAKGDELPCAALSPQCLWTISNVRCRGKNEREARQCTCRRVVEGTAEIVPCKAGV